MPVGQTNRRTFIAGLGGAAAWPLVARATPVRDRDGQANQRRQLPAR
jgi:hypothetical protein